MAAFTCILSADAPCVWQEHRAVIELSSVVPTASFGDLLQAHQPQLEVENLGGSAYHHRILAALLSLQTCGSHQSKID